MYDSLIRLDKELFLYLNHFHSPFWDQVIWVLTGNLIWIPIYLAVIFFLIYKFKRRAILIVLFTAAGIVLSDFISVHAFKDVFLRLRPSHEPSLAGLVHIVKNYRGGLYGFVSSHAANTFMLAVFTLSVIRKWYYTICILCWALLMCCTRIYLGVHYPADILAGALLGSAIALLWSKVWQKTDRIIVKRYPWWK
jgi:undecaprenyl-diphosphatase